jgi:hypothetical protein
MKLINVLDLGVAVELLADDCLAIADALARCELDAGNVPHRRALQTAFRACAILAASDTNMDGKAPAREWFKKTRDVWANIDTTTIEHRKVTEEPR